MKRIVLSLLVVTTLGLTSCKNDKKGAETTKNEASVASNQAETFKVDKEQSLITWEATKVIGGGHVGNIKLAEGEVSVGNNKIEAGNFVIDMATVEVTDIGIEDGKEKLEAHLKGNAEAEKADHFFNINKFPTANFEITSVKTDDKKNVVAGNLTIKGITKKIEFPATIKNENGVLNIDSEVFTINRTDFNVKFNSGSFFKDLGDNAIDDDVKITIKVVAKK